MKYIALTIVALAIFNVGCSAADVNVCSGCANGVFLANLSDCNSYITCYGEVGYPGTCPANLTFDASQQKCIGTTQEACPQICGPELKTLVYTKTCTKFVMCFAGTPIVRECLDGLQYNVDTDRCDFAQNVDCQTNLCVGVHDPENIVYLKSHQSCSKYFICYNGTADPFYCSNNLQFNLAKQGCDYKANVNCVIAAMARNVMSYAKMPPTRANIPCPKDGAHFYAHESEASSYYFCSNGKGIVLTCTPGLVYDESVEACREPSNVGK